MMRHAFTMIELVFVIVIVGILAAVAIPRLQATRIDAKLSATAHSIATTANEIAAYAASKNATNSDLTVMSNVAKSLVMKSEATKSDYRLEFKVEGINDCIIIKIDGNGTSTETLILEYGDTTNKYCDVVRGLIDANDYPLHLRGRHIKY